MRERDRERMTGKGIRNGMGKKDREEQRERNWR